jgi:hypothetical protein
MLVSSYLPCYKEEGSIFILQTGDLAKFGLLLIAGTHS